MAEPEPVREPGPGPGLGIPPGRGKGELEAEVLAAIQRAAPDALTPGEVQERVDSRLAYTTVVTALSRMHDKGLLTRTKRGRAYAYTAVADDSGLTALRMRRVLEGGSDREAVLTRFVGELSDADEDFLRRLLDPGR